MLKQHATQGRVSSRNDKAKELRKRIDDSLDTLATSVDEVRSSRYIALWDGDSKALRSSLERIADTARTLIDDLESVQAGKAVA